MGKPDYLTSPTYHANIELPSTATTDCKHTDSNRIHRYVEDNVLRNLIVLDGESVAFSSLAIGIFGDKSHSLK